MSAGVEGLLSRLEGVRATGPGCWMAPCPAHADQDPSLSIRDAAGTLLLKCFAGCRAAAVVAAVGVELRDLFPPVGRPIGPERPRGERRDLEAALDHELNVLALTLGRRVTECRLSKDRMPNGWAPLPAGHWEREVQAARRVLILLPRVYPELAGRAAA